MMRISMIVTLAGLCVYSFGGGITKKIAVPFFTVSLIGVLAEYDDDTVAGVDDFATDTIAGDAAIL